MLFYSNSELYFLENLSSLVSLTFRVVSKFHNIIAVFQTWEKILCAYKKAVGSPQGIKSMLNFNLR